MMPNKTMFMIVTLTNPKKSSLIIIINADSIIAPPPHISVLQLKVVEVYVFTRCQRWQHTPLILISLTNIQYIFP